MRHVHDRGGWPDTGPINKTEHDYSMWEKRTDAMLRVLTSNRKMLRPVSRPDGILRPNYLLATLRSIRAGSTPCLPSSRRTS